MSKISQCEGIQLAKINDIYKSRINGAKTFPSVILSKYQNVSIGFEQTKSQSTLQFKTIFSIGTSILLNVELNPTI